MMSSAAANDPKNNFSLPNAPLFGTEPDQTFLILINRDDVLCGRSKQLRFVPVSFLRQNDLNTVDLTNLLAAKILLEGNNLHLKGSSALHGLEFDGIDYSVEENGQRIQRTVTRDNIQLETLTAEEELELQEKIRLAAEALNKEKSESKDKPAEEKVGQSGCITIISATSSASKFIAFMLSQAALKAQQRLKESHKTERALDKAASIDRDIRERKEKNREARWKLRQEHYQKKEQNHWERLQEDRKIWPCS